jgi:multiple sugar transport system ATP-binding protein
MLLVKLYKIFEKNCSTWVYPKLEFFYILLNRARRYQRYKIFFKWRKFKMASLSLKHINKKYPNGFEAVKDFNLEIEDKEFVIFVGPSGCGKSTTLRMVAGLEDISSGELWIGDKLVNDVEPKDRDIAMVFQNYALYPHMTVYDNMAFGLKLRKVPKDEIDKMVREAAKILDLEALLDRKPKALSGGQRQRVAMGRAIVRNPKVFLMDEPLSNLDAKLRGQMRIEISKLHQRLGTTIIYVTHDQTEAMTLGTRIVVMSAGIVQQVDTPQTLYDRPCNLFVAGFIGSPQMNFVDAKCKVEGKKVFLQAGPASIELPEAKAKKLIDGGYSGKTVVLGVRPEDVHDEPEFLAKSPNTIIEATIRVYEMLGAEVYLHFDYEGATMTARVDPRTSARSGSTVKFALDADRIHVFDKETENTITN